MRNVDFLCPQRPSVSELRETGGAGPEARVGERWALPIDPKMPRAPAFSPTGPVSGAGEREPVMGPELSALC